MRAHKPIHKPPSPNITRVSWLIAVSPTFVRSGAWLKHKHTHTHTYARTHGAHSSSSRSRAAGRQGAPHWWPDGADTMRPIVHTCWSVPRRGLTAAHKADVALNHQCISMRGSHRSRLCVCVGRDVTSGGGDCNKAKHICRLDKPQLCGVCNPKPGQWLSPLPASADSILIYDSNEYRFSRSSFPPSPPLFPSISPFNKRVNDVCALISNQLFLFSFYLSSDKFSVAPAESNASLSRALHLITNWPSDSKQGNNEGTFNSESVTSASTLSGHKFVSASFRWHWRMMSMNTLTPFSSNVNRHVPLLCTTYCPYFVTEIITFSTFFSV